MVAIATKNNTNHDMKNFTKPKVKEMDFYNLKINPFEVKQEKLKANMNWPNTIAIDFHSKPVPETTHRPVVETEIIEGLSHHGHQENYVLEVGKR